MKEVTLIQYQCELCGHKYGSKELALECESRPVKLTGLKVGDIVKIMNGEGKGQKAKVYDFTICDKNWGHYAWERLWHTERVTVECFESYGSRTLCIGDFEKI